ncbi:hypothetical protein TB2_029325 [Malus domestica]|nr:uncharacterized protein LOC126614226 isoform X1 [Malus sylvestris]
MFVLTLILGCNFRDNFMEVFTWSILNISCVLSMARSRNAIVATGLVIFAAAGLAFPFYMASSPKPVIDPSKPLSPQATFRGPYINTGSRDVGPDYQTYPKK